MAIIWLGRVIHDRATVIQAQFSDLTSARARKSLGGARRTRRTGKKRRKRRTSKEMNEAYATKNLPGSPRVQGAFFPLFSLLGGVSAAMVLYVGGRLVITGAISVGEFVAFGVYLGMLVWPMIALGWAVSLVQRGAASMARINELFAQQPAIKNPEQVAALPPARGGGRSRFRSLVSLPRCNTSGGPCKISRSGSPRVRPSPWSARRAPASRALAELITRTYDPERGAILLDGVDIRDLPLDVLRHEIGVRAAGDLSLQRHRPP